MRIAPSRRPLSLAAFTVAALVACAASASSIAQDKLRVAGNFTTDHSSSLAIDQWKRDVERGSNGKLGIDVFPNMQLGGAQENVSQVRTGLIFMTWVGMAFLSRTVPELEAVSLPFLFPSREVAYKVMDGPVGQALDKRLADKGFIALGFMELGERQVTNSVRPIKTVADLKGLKIRMQPNETHLATFRALGANPVAMDIREVYMALEQKVVDGHENPYNLILASRFNEVQKYVSNAGHFFDFIAVVANRKRFEALSPELRELVRKSMASAVAGQRASAAKADIEALAELQRKGMQFDPMAAGEREQMRKLTAGVVNDIRKRAGGDLVDLVLAEVRKASGTP